MEKTIYKMNREAEALMKKTAADTNASETEFEAAATAMAKTTLQQGEIELDYFNKFSKYWVNFSSACFSRKSCFFDRNLLNLLK